MTNSPTQSGHTERHFSHFTRLLFVGNRCARTFCHWDLFPIAVLDLMWRQYHSNLPKFETFVPRAATKYSLDISKLHVRRADVYALDNSISYDLVVIKDALGGYNREHNMREFKSVVGICMLILKSKGHLLIIDKGHQLSPIHWMHKKWGKAGKNKWHYFTRTELEQLTPPGCIFNHYSSYGVLHFSNIHSQPIQRALDVIDHGLLEKLIPPEHRAVFSVSYQKTSSQ